MERAKKEPRRVTPFLRALARTGDVRAAAEDAGIDHSTAYPRRKTHPEFAGLWRGALAVHESWAKGKEAEEIEALRQAPPPPSAVPLSHRLRRQVRIFVVGERSLSGRVMIGGPKPRRSFSSRSWRRRGT
jgi:hypothetical protein